MPQVWIPRRVRRNLNVEVWRRHEEGRLRPTGVAMIERTEEGERQLLLAKSAKNGGWGFPKGGIKDREDVVKGTLREVREETGLRHLLVLAHCLTESVKKPLYEESGLEGKEFYYFYLKLTKPQPLVLQATEIEKIEWVPRRCVPEFIIRNNPDESRREKVLSMLRAHANVPEA